MRVGIPKEIKEDENRIAITPAGVAAFRLHGHEVFIETGAGAGSHIPDEAYARAGVAITRRAEQVWEPCDLVLKVKEPLGPEVDLMRPGQVIFTYLHLAASEALAHTLLEKKIVGIGYQTVQLADGTLPLLLPMSEVAGRLSIQVGAKSLEMMSGGKGILLPGVSGVRRGRENESCAGERRQLGGPPNRFRLHESVVQKAVADAARQAGLTKRVSPHTFRHHADCRIMPTSVSQDLGSALAAALWW